MIEKKITDADRTEFSVDCLLIKSVTAPDFSHVSPVPFLVTTLPLLDRLDYLWTFLRLIFGLPLFGPYYRNHD